jgi:hypothetical protein
VDLPADRLEVVYGSRARDVADVIEERRALPEAPITTDVMLRALQTARAMLQRVSIAERNRSTS